MAQNYEIAELGQVLTSNISGNVISLSSTLSLTNLALSGQIVLNGTSGQSLYVLTSNGSSNAYWALPTPSINAAATVAFTNTTASSNATSGAMTLAGGLGVYGNVYTAGVYGLSNTSNVSVAYTYYNESLNTIDTVFG